MATIDANTGVLTSVAVGSVKVTATSGSVSSSTPATVTVAPPPPPKGSINFDPDKPADVVKKTVRKSVYDKEYKSEYSEDDEVVIEHVTPVTETKPKKRRSPRKAKVD